MNRIAHSLASCGVLLVAAAFLSGCASVHRGEATTGDVGGRILDAQRLQDGKFALVVMKETGGSRPAFEVQVRDESEPEKPRRAIGLPEATGRRILMISEEIVAYARYDDGKGTVRVAETAGGEEGFSWEMKLSACGPMGAPACGEFLAWAESSESGEEFIRAVDLAKPEEVIDMPLGDSCGTGPIGALAVSPDGSSVVFATRNQPEPVVGIADIVTRRVVWSRALEWPGEVAFKPDGKTIVVGPARAAGSKGVKVTVFELDAATGEVVMQKDHVDSREVLRGIGIGLALVAVAAAIVSSDDDHEHGHEYDEEDDNWWFEDEDNTVVQEPQAPARGAALASDLSAGGRFLAFARKGYVFVYDLIERRQVATMPVSRKGPRVLFISGDAKGIWAEGDDGRSLNYHRFSK
jgi:hypothetical protein